MKKTSFWRVPVIALIAGLLWTPVVVRLLLWFSIKKAEDGTVTTNETAELLVYGGVLLAILLIGGFIGLRKCTRREIFFSASLLVGYNILKNVLMMSSGSVTGAGAVLFSYLHTPVQWTVFPTLLLIKVFSVDLTNSVQSFLVGVPAYFVPYIFMLFGKQSNT